MESIANEYRSADFYRLRADYYNQMAKVESRSDNKIALYTKASQDYQQASEWYSALTRGTEQIKIVTASIRKSN